jgi:hypothetical protein
MVVNREQPRDKRDKVNKLLTWIAAWNREE